MAALRCLCLLASQQRTMLFFVAAADVAAKQAVKGRDGGCVSAFKEKCTIENGKEVEEICAMLMIMEIYGRMSFCGAFSDW